VQTPLGSLFRFGPFQVNSDSGELLKNGNRVKLQEQPFRLLVILLENAGEVVTRDDLRHRIWRDDMFVDFDGSLRVAVRKLREALGDDAENPRYVETIPKRGYRFLAPEISSSTNGNNRGTISADTTPEIVRILPPLADARDASADLHGRNADKPRTTHLSQAAVPRIAVILAAAMLLAAAVFVYFRPKPAIAPARALTRITFDEGLQADPTWSPDGRYIAYSANRGGATNIWMQQISVGDPIQITTGPGPNWQPDWSPDGRYIAYRSDAGEEGIFVVPAVGGAGQERRIATFGDTPRWSPDGSQILFQDNPVSWTDRSKFYVVGLDGGPPRQVLDEFFRQHSFFYPISAAWHPDGKRVTIWVSDRSQAVPSQDSSQDFWTLPLEGGTPVQSAITPQIQQWFTSLAVRSGYESVVDSKFVWAPSGKALYLERTFRGTRSLWRLSIDPRTLRATGIEQLTAGAGIATAPAISPDGKRLAFTAASAEIGAWLQPLDANRGRISGQGISVTSPGVDAWLPALTRDGSKLAFSGVRAGETRLWVKSLPDGRELPLFVDSYNRGSPQWSPDGTRLAYTRQLKERVPGVISMWSGSQIMVWSAETRQEEAVTSLSTRRSAKEPLVARSIFDWSPDGRSLLVSKMSSLQGIRSIQSDVTVWQVPISAAPHAELQERKIIAKPGFRIWQPHFSPDGQWIAFEAANVPDPGGQTELRSSLYVMRATGGPWIPIVNDSNWADKPRWSPDGKTIYFLWSRGSFFNVWAIHFNPETGKAVGKPFQVTSLDSPSRMIPRDMADVEISVSQKSLVTTLEQVSGGIWVLDNVDH
jgi:Tol biopolymer transport system component/DNA-binding winged helix-turn-helix (wHTH) protein